MGNHQVKLFTAAQSGHLDEVKSMISQHSVEVNVEDNDGRTALMVAAEAGHLKIVQYLIQEGKADSNHKDHVSDVFIYSNWRNFANPLSLLNCSSVNPR